MGQSERPPPGVGPQPEPGAGSGTARPPWRSGAGRGPSPASWSLPGRLRRPLPAAGPRRRNTKLQTGASSAIFPAGAKSGAAGQAGGSGRRGSAPARRGGGAARGRAGRGAGAPWWEEGSRRPPAGCGLVPRAGPAGRLRGDRRPIAAGVGAALSGPWHSAVPCSPAGFSFDKALLEISVSINPTDCRGFGDLAPSSQLPKHLSAPVTFSRSSEMFVNPLTLVLETPDVGRSVGAT